MATSTHHALVLPTGRSVHLWSPPGGSSRSLLLPSGPARIAPSFAVKSATFTGPGKSKAPHPLGRVSPNCPINTSREIPAGPPCAPGPAPRPLPALYQAPERGPPASRCRSDARVVRPTPARRQHPPESRAPSPPPHWGSTLRGRDAKKCPPTG